jgi:hypothetical protein
LSPFFNLALNLNLLLLICYLKVFCFHNRIKYNWPHMNDWSFKIVVPFPTVLCCYNYIECVSCYMCFFLHLASQFGVVCHASWSTVICLSLLGCIELAFFSLIYCWEFLLESAKKNWIRVIDLWGLGEYCCCLLLQFPIAIVLSWCYAVNMLATKVNQFGYLSVILNASTWVLNCHFLFYFFVDKMSFVILH